MLQLSSQIAYTSEPDQHPHGHTIAGVTVLAEVVDLETGERKKSNTVSTITLCSCIVLITRIVLTLLSSSRHCAPTVPLQLRPRHHRPSNPATNIQGSHGVH